MKKPTQPGRQGHYRFDPRVTVHQVKSNLYRVIMGKDEIGTVWRKAQWSAVWYAKGSPLKYHTRKQAIDFLIYAHLARDAAQLVSR